jgi:hypothetical protein
MKQHEKEIEKQKESKSWNETHIVRWSRWSMSLKRSCRWRHSLRALGSRNRSSNNILWKRWWQLSHHGLLMRMPFGGSRRTKRTSCCSIFLRNIVVTKEKCWVLTGKKIEVKDK